MLGILLLVIFCTGFAVLLLLIPRTLIMILIISALHDKFELNEVQMIYFFVPYLLTVLWDMISLVIRIRIFCNFCEKVKKWWIIP